MKRIQAIGILLVAVAVGFSLRSLAPQRAEATPLYTVGVVGEYVRGQVAGLPTSNCSSAAASCVSASVTTGAIVATTAVFTGTIQPAADNTYNIGAAGKTWSDIFANAIKDTDSDARLTFTNGAATNVLGNVADGSTAIAVKVGNSNVHSTAGAKIIAFYIGNGLVTEKANIDIDGSYHHVGNPTLKTCTAALEGVVSRDVLSGIATGKRTKLCLCTSNGSSTYVWQNMATATLGTTTACGSE